MHEEIVEIRRLVALVQSRIAGVSGVDALADRAKILRSTVHETLDAGSVVHGIRALEGLLRDIATEGIGGCEDLLGELAEIKEASQAWRDHVSNDRRTATPAIALMRRWAAARRSGAPEAVDVAPQAIGSFSLSLDATIDRDLLELAETVCDRLQQGWTIGPQFLLFQPHTPRSDRAKFTNISSGMSDCAYRHSLECAETLVSGLGEFDTWAGKSTRLFRILRAACEIALRSGNEWVEPLLRLTIVAAQELRLEGSTGMHGPDRLIAKLIIGGLVGQLSTYRLDAALSLADLTIESSVFSRSQVLYAQERNPAVLGRLVERWETRKHPLDRDIVGQASCFIGDMKGALESLRSGAEYLRSARVEVWSSDQQGVSYKKKYTEHLQDIYLARLARSLSLVDLDEALRWCAQITTPAIREGCRVSIHTNASSCGREDIARMSPDVAGLPTNLAPPTERGWLQGYELHYLPHLTTYPEFPAERWADMVAGENALREIRWSSHA